MIPTDSIWLVNENGEDRQLGRGHPTLLVAEVGTTCNGDLATMHKLIDAVADAGADAIKPMLINPDEFMARRDVTYTYQTADGPRSENMYEMFKGLMFSDLQWRQIVSHIRDTGLLYWFTVDYIAGVALAEELGTAAYKVSAWDIRNFPLIRAMAETGLPILIDLGPALVGEVLQILEFIEKHGNAPVVLVHGTHGSYTHANLRSIPYLSEKFAVPVGWTSDGLEDTPDVLAMAAGACLVEKRITLDRKTLKHHHSKALEPKDFTAWVKTMRMFETMLGEHAVIPSLEDLRQKDLYFTSIVAARDIAEGEAVTEEMLAAKRPGTGISPLYIDRFVGERTKRAFKENETWTWDAVP